MLLEQACGQCFKVKIKQCENPHSAKKIPRKSIYMILFLHFELTVAITFYIPMFSIILTNQSSHLSTILNFNFWGKNA